MSLKELKQKRSNDNVTSAKPTQNKAEEAKPPAEEEKVKRTGSIKGNGFIMWYTGAERRAKSFRHVDEFPDRLPLEPLSEEDKQGATFRVKPKKKEKPKPLLLEYKKEYTEKQKKWQENVLKSEDLRQEVGPYRKSHNRLKLLRYIFINDVIYSKNGLLYYLIPLICNIVFLILNLHIFSFFENVVFATVATIPLNALIVTFKSKKSSLFKILATLTIFTVCLFGLFHTAHYLPDFWAKVHLPYALIFNILWFLLVWKVLRNMAYNVRSGPYVRLWKRFEN